MRATLLAFALLLSTAARAEEAKPAPALPADAESCLMCHDKGGGAPEVDFKAFPGSVHGQAEVGCTDCHAGYKEGPHEGELPALSAAEQATVARLAKGAWGEGEAKHGVTAPRAYLACQSCHTTEADAFAKSVHGKWLAQDTKAPGATCASCHGSPHSIPAKLAEYAPKDGKRVPVPADRREMTKRCEACHGNEAFAEAAGLNPEAVITYHDSIHGRLTRVGNAAAPTCVSCHAAAADAGGTHAIVSKTDPASTVSAANKKQACARCHAGATDTFAGLVAHKPLHETGGSVIPHIVHVAFSWLTTLTLLFFAFHVLVDFIYELRTRLAKKGGHGPSADAVRSVIRFDLHQRIQHWFMLSGVILLGITGWPLRGAGDAEAATYSRAFMKVFGGAEGAATWHRVGAVLIIISAAYHLFYLTFLASKKRLPLSMLPVPKDALDMRDNILFMMGVKKERPKFDRYMYLEKFDYWAVFWGIVMMVGTGFIFWFPVWFASWAPGWLITAAQIIHGEEATLAILFLFTVHFYNVHLKPSIFPMNWAWLNGRISIEAMKHEHPLEYDRLKDEQNG
ncbi:cytochrome b/b6 domain-containing protein [Anaeromyxobacter sp. PSR-1]|uniref:cytochrome b/b6 domain-containing protein n=1 Tax=Anaeromyxobacter sp. PSR-1 TaxID=1300915 RepID=UPI0005E17701|nr:cytochrome b/b6 domain-containing protein [Anaeromyxobacter sp. PSR-1]GAO02578.1 formate dehydrogenase-O subunit gamma [Anaeromyxobacter sp. PSR-1]